MDDHFGFHLMPPFVGIFPLPPAHIGTGSKNAPGLWAAIAQSGTGRHAAIVIGERSLANRRMHMEAQRSLRFVKPRGKYRD
jgi:hypothetical protein